MIRSKQEKITFRLVLTAISLFVLLALSVIFRAGEYVCADGTDTVKSAREFLQANGWQVIYEPEEIATVFIPEVFDAVYNTYNDIQLQQGFDLRKYCGMKAERVTFTVTNYEGYEDTDTVRANLLFVGDELIGADICSVSLYGFMHGVRTNQWKRSE